MIKPVRNAASGVKFENRLSRKIADEIDNQLKITFERFIEHALYDAEFGYYANGGGRIWEKGDFYTSPTAHRAFGQTVARFAGGLRKRIEAADGTEKFTVLEVGGGNGRLALDILSALARTDPETYGCVEYILLDICKPQKCEVSGAHSNFRRVESFTEIGEPVTGIIVSNELFDAIPFHRLVFRNGQIREIFVSKKENRFTETEGAPSRDGLISYFDRYGGTDKMGFTENRQFEVCLRASEMLKQMADILKKGAILTIDYGFRTEELFNPSRQTGTFKCVSGHKINLSPYENIGGQDITAHVDFGNLEKTGEGSGLETLKYTTQGQFLIDWGIMEIAGRNPDEIAAIQNLFMPSMMGDCFRVLIQTKNADELKEGFYPESPVRISFGVD